VHRRRTRGNRRGGGDFAASGGDAARESSLRCRAVVAEDAERSAAPARPPPPRNTTVAAITRLPRPYPTPRTRNTVYERRAWRVKAQIVSFKLEDDSDIHLILYSAGRYMIAELPLAGCLPRTTRDRRAIVAARAAFVRRCGFPTLDRQPLGAVALVSGVGFWDVRARAERRRAKLRRAASGDRASPHRRLRVAASRRSRGDACEAGKLPQRLDAVVKGEPAGKPGAPSDRCRCGHGKVATNCTYEHCNNRGVGTTNAQGSKEVG
jgi:hypothetical protein